MPDWSDESQRISGQITSHVHDYFGLKDDHTFLDSVTNEADTVGALLAELAHQLKFHPEPPFTYQRLNEMAELGPAEKQQYASNHGIAYLRAAVQLARVTSPATVFNGFDNFMNQKLPDNIRLEPIEWASVDIGGLPSLMMDPIETCVPRPATDQTKTNDPKKLKLDPENDLESKQDAERDGTRGENHNFNPTSASASATDTKLLLQEHKPEGEHKPDLEVESELDKDLKSQSETSLEEVSENTHEAAPKPVRESTPNPASELATLEEESADSAQESFDGEIASKRQNHEKPE